uniref:Small ribosomal subunit protein uS4c n=1 Tax=Selaginella lepidophylla TaxID=59777 RepID=A0A3Q9R4A4_SELLP|nr:ribosomal protein S4 [Selaginella lepidophylla]AZU95907.1 ribosomal protein S4 [Selaginella lepidophylla]
MSRYRGPRVKVVRRLGRLPGLTRKKGKKKPGYTPQYTPTKKASQYRIRLDEKQKLRFHYGLGEQQLLRYVRTARRAKGPTGQVLLQSLEMRLDSTIFRLGMAPTIPGARQLVTHKHILVNDRVISIPGHRCEHGDAVTVRLGRAGRNNGNYSPDDRIAEPTQLASYPLSGLVDQLVDRKRIDLNMNELLVVEYYSRQA